MNTPIWCIECGIAVDEAGRSRPDLPAAPGAKLGPCVFCAQREATGEVDARKGAPC
jgi:hypothetical protein